MMTAKKNKHHNWTAVVLFTFNQIKVAVSSPLKTCHGGLNGNQENQGALSQSHKSLHHEV